MYNPIEVSQAARKACQELRESGGVGYTEPGNVLTWDGNTEDTEIVTNGKVGFARVSTRAFDLYNIETVVCNIEGDLLTYTASEVTIEDMDGNGKCIALSLDGLLFVTSVVEAGEYQGIYFPVGTYFFALEDVWTTKAKFTETIHPIDPKFLPGVCLPVVELTTQPANDGAKMTEEEVGTLASLINSGTSAIIVPVTFDFGKYFVMCSIAQDDGTIRYRGFFVAIINNALTKCALDLNLLDAKISVFVLP